VERFGGELVEGRRREVRGREERGTEERGEGGEGMRKGKQWRGEGKG
jgi:hypothetical protein